MYKLLDDIAVNINSFGTFSAIIVLIFFIITFIIYSIFFHQVALIRYSLLLECIMTLYLTLFLIMVNSTNAIIIFHATRLLYATFMIHSIASIYAVSHIASEPNKLLKLFSIIFSILIISFIYVNDTWMITREINISTYYFAVKGPLFPIMIIYIFLIGIFMVLNFYLLYKRRPKDIKHLWPVFTGIIFFTFYIDLVGISLYLQPLSKPSIYIGTLVFLFLFLLYIFKQVKENITERENLYMTYLYDDLTGVHTRNYILEEINKSLKKRKLKNHFIAMIDIDGFKKINDTYGHIVGDQVLKNFGKILNEMNVSCYLPGRLGGDEFIIYAKDSTYEEVRKSLINLLRSYTFLLTEMNIDALKNQAGLSIGLIDFDSTMTLKEILTLADKTMYKAKKSGKNTIRTLDHLHSTT